MRSKVHRLRVLARKLISPLLKWFYLKYTSKDQKFKYQDIELDIYAGVFPPRFFHTTHFLLDYLTKQEIADASFLELGAGTGLISLYAAQQTAKVTASDISEIAVNNIKTNAQKNNFKISVIKSDLFKKIRKKSFDWIVINPPFYPSTPQSDPEYAWYCGENFEYFENLFKNISSYMNENSHVIMVLSDRAPIKKIIFIAGKNNIIMRVESLKKHLLERSFIFTLNKGLELETNPSDFSRF